MKYPQYTTLLDVAVIADTTKDNIALCKITVQKEDILQYKDVAIRLSDDVQPGDRFALHDIFIDENLIQYGYPFAKSKGILRGEKIISDNIVDEIPTISDVSDYPTHPAAKYAQTCKARTFMGYQRNDGRCGTRNFVIIVPTSMCASAVAQQIAERFSGEYPGVDAVIALSNTEGCGCANGMQIERFLTVLKNSISHENVASALIIDLGCEQTNYAVVKKFLGSENEEDYEKPIDWLTIQHIGGAAKTVSRGVEIVAQRLQQFATVARNPCPISSLTIGSECGASDAFSGITANRVIGVTVDRVIAAGGSAIFSEFPEMVGAEQILFPRMRDKGVRDKFVRQMNWYKEIAFHLGTSMVHNLVPENKVGGLINPFIKSLGAVMKGGTAIIEDVIDYGERIHSNGLHIMQGPGNDLESVTGLAASGATIICFSTGRGTVTGCALVPVIKISSTSALYDRMSDDMDFDAGRILFDSRTPDKTLQELGEALVETVISIASGCKTKSEINRQRQFQIWTAGKLSL